MSTTDVVVRRLTDSDLAEMVAVERRAFTTPWSLGMFVLELSKVDGVCLAACLPGGAIAGYVICSRYDDVWHVMNVAVDPPHRRRGLATRLLEAVLAEVGADARLTLEVRPTNAAAIALYEDFGFIAVGVRAGYYADNGEDALIMWRTPATLRGALDDVPATGPVPPTHGHS